MISLLRPLADFALPPRCGGCGVPVETDGGFCADCWGSLRFVGPPWCVGCHRPFEINRGLHARCDDCLMRAPRHEGVSAAVAYGPVARRLALKLKYGGRMGVADTMASLMRRHLPADADVLVPVPLHRWRLWSRGYNQAGLIAAGLARASGVSCDTDLLARTRKTPVLKGLSGTQRRRAVGGAFAVTASARIGSRHAVLVDDVYTSGSTIDACTAALLDAGAARVSVLCWARVLGSDDEGDD